ncbi:hypothetical protein A0J48_006950 [Sphaerospermopsis aphanizomenoides BCCUSP55]|uniref:hypothetical protein n=1 Tax=Sphaerospermopsis aphanizomenoides TaxID=459663 RepID=UPI00190739C4|nr:hypothetical protein [Sphaerospermopsis aphanizomenoides]MBK1987274.1 hypothetical protein [Sphaerospermopsis aphanizomenoides BCCUSP55]
MLKTKTFKTCADFCKAIRLLVEKKRHPQVLYYAVKLGYVVFDREDSWSVTYRLKDGINPTQADVLKVAEAINSL